MATTISEKSSRRGGTNLQRDYKKNLSGSPKMARKQENTRKHKNSPKQASGSVGAGDVVSDDDSGANDDDGDSSAVGATEHDDDQPDAFALSDAMSTSSRATSRLAGLDPERMFENNAHMTTHDRNDDNDEDDDYAAIADISDSEVSSTGEDEDSILRIAERDLIAEFERTEKPRNTAAVADRIDQMKIDDDQKLARRLSLQSEDSQQDFDIALDLTEDPFRGLSSNDDLYKEMIEDAEVAFDDDLTRWRMPEGARSRENSVQSVSHKKVRFESTPSRASSMSSDEDPRDTYPDLFADLENPLPRARVAPGNAGLDSQDVESVYDFDFEDEYEKAAMNMNGVSTSDDDMAGADSEDGDTTDEETVDEQLARMRAMQKAKGKSTEHIGISAPSTPAANGGRKAVGSSRRTSASSRFETPRSGKKPRSGTFVHDPTRATVSADIRGSGVKLICPTNPPEKDRAYWERARAAMSSRDGSPRESWTRTTPRAPSIPQRPLTAKSTLGTLFDGNLDFLRNHDVAGIAGDLLDSSGDGRMRSSFTSATLTEDDGSDDESNVNMEDFVQMGDSDSDMDEPASATSMLSPQQQQQQQQQQDFYSDFSLVSSPIARQDSASAGLLDHLDQQRGLVTSFRTNQHRARHFSSLASHPAKRAQASEHNALQAGRRNAANTPMTPARKSRPSQDLTGATPVGIRKPAPNAASPIATRHRRSRGSSLSGMHQTLALDRFASSVGGK